jgi:hypothetical protein
MVLLLPFNGWWMGPFLSKPLGSGERRDVDGAHIGRSLWMKKAGRIELTVQQK